jgi:transcriptional regulator with XRE-family HTH domain
MSSLSGVGAALAGLVGRSESWLSQVERGIRSVYPLSVLLDMAKIRMSMSSR